MLAGWLLLSAMTFAVIMASLLPFSYRQIWWIRDCDFPRMQILTLGVLTLVGVLVWLPANDVYSWVLASSLLACLALQLWWIFPYTPMFPPEVRPVSDRLSSPRISIVTANVLMTNRGAEQLIGHVRQWQPDVLVTLESNNWWEAQLKVLEADYPWTVKCPLDNLYGMHVYSAIELRDSRIEYLVEPDVPSIHAELILRDGTAVRTHFLHPAPPSPTENEASVERDAELIVVAKSLADEDRPVIVTGDFNDVAWSRTTRLFRKISGLRDPRVGRGMFNTFHAGYWFLRWPLDHLFHSQHFTLGHIERLPPIGSDHFALYTELYFEPGNGAAAGLAADPQDQDLADELTDKEAVEADDVPMNSRQDTND